MKKYFLAAAVLIAVMLTSNLKAQVHVNLNVNVSDQPAWGPTGYDHVEYYYMPDIDAYYYVPAREYIYFEGGRWVRTYSLPPRFHHYDIYRGYKVVINDPQPYRHNEVYRSKYGQYRGRYDEQEVIRDKGHHDHGRSEGHDKHGHS